jgi:hypothetical protein
MQEKDEYSKIAELVDCFDDIPQMMNRIRAGQKANSRFTGKHSSKLISYFC